ncbi:MAG: hypothetical protein P0S95_01990 [Rhabdochlamydiaceae bacterium]|nr:hypothetical protein [Candidatus Amphrikana amoebophyrae]
MTRINGGFTAEIHEETAKAAEAEHARKSKITPETTFFSRATAVATVVAIAVIATLVIVFSGGAAAPIIGAVLSGAILSIKPIRDLLLFKNRGALQDLINKLSYGEASPQDKIDGLNAYIDLKVSDDDGIILRYIMPTPLILEKIGKKAKLSGEQIVSLKNKAEEKAAIYSKPAWIPSESPAPLATPIATKRLKGTPALRPDGIATSRSSKGRAERLKSTTPRSLHVQIKIASRLILKNKLTLNKLLKRIQRGLNLGTFSLEALGHVELPEGMDRKGFYYAIVDSFKKSDEFNSAHKRNALTTDIFIKMRMAIITKLIPKQADFQEAFDANLNSETSALRGSVISMQLGNTFYPQKAYPYYGSMPAS